MDFSEELRRFRERTGGRRVPGLILPGSLQATTAALLIGALEPRRVAFLLTPDTADTPAAAAALLGRDPDGWERYADDHTDTLQVYRSLRAIIEAWSDLPRDQIAVDLTGGTKPMSVGLAKAAYVLQIEALYIESDFAADAGGRRLPQPGTQRLAPPPDPYLVFGDLEAAEAARLWAAHDYPGAQRIYAELARRVPGGDGAGPAAAYDLRAGLAAAYAHWDGFDLAGAEAELRRLRDHPALAEGARRRLDAQIELLAAVRPLVEASRPEYGSRDYLRAMGRFAEGRLRLLAEPPIAAGLLATLYANALRRARQGRRDAAALMLYRCLELMSQQRLATYGVYTEWARDPMARLAARFPQLRALRPEWKKIALAEGYQILQAIGDPFGARCNLQRIRDGADTRNQSLLAHGFTFISAADYGSFKQVVDEVCAEWCACAEVVWEGALQRATFLTLDQL